MAFNNATEYKALLAGFKISREIQVKRLMVNCDSQLVVSQVKDNFATREKNMAFYMKKVMELLPCFERFELTQISRVENTHVDALSKLASSKDSELLKVVPIEHFPRLSISKGDEVRIEGTAFYM